MKDDIESVNKEYYDNSYRPGSWVRNILLPLFSFDQQSKSKYNYRYLKKYLRERGKGLKILDFGFGRGTLLLKFPRHSHLFGCDLSSQAVENFPKTAAAFGRRVHTFLPDDYPKSTIFDVIVLSHVLEHVENDVELLEILSSKLHAQGRILINLPINEVWTDPKHIREYNKEGLEALLAQIDFSILNTKLCDKWTAFFLTKETQNGVHRTNYFTKGLRFLCSIMPIEILESIEKIFLKKYPYQQIIVFAKSNRS